ncbi:MAG: hypothetical protein O3A96_07250 [Proteobacteria bacterium]|nr:hypothetical protein [Pseudomonadota bacterium]
MDRSIARAQVLPEAELPDASALLDEGRKAAKTHGLGPSAFHDHYGVESEADYKRRCGAEGRVMMHAQIGFRDPAKSRRAYGEIWERLDKAGYRLDRFGICLDWSMGYPAAMRAEMPRGTGLIFDGPEDLAAMTAAAPVAPHFGDFVIGTPAAFENTVATLAAGSTSIGNLGQYFTFRQPHWDDDVAVTAESLKAMALAAAQPVEVLIHSNLDDGFASMFSDLACSLGAVLIEKHIVETLVGGRVGHCFGNTFSKPVKRFAFQRALSMVTDTPGTLVTGATTMYGPDHALNAAALANYIRLDALAQRLRPTGHAVQPIPLTEAERIPDIDEIVEVHLIANRTIELEAPFEAMHDTTEADAMADRIVEGGRRFAGSVLAGLEEGGIDTKNPLELLLAIRRIGCKRLEELFGPGAAAPGRLRGRMPVETSTSIEEVEESGEGKVAALDPVLRETIQAAGLRGCVATTDVHEYGKILVETVLGRLAVEIVDGGVSIDPNDLAETVAREGADFIALSSYNGVALDFLRDLEDHIHARGIDLPIFIGGKLNRIPDGSNTSLPVDIGGELTEAGAVVCRNIDDIFGGLGDIAATKAAKVSEAAAP